MSEENTDTKALEPDTQSEVAPKPKPKAKAQKFSQDFGDPALTRPGIEPLGGDKRDKKTLHHVLDNVGLALSPTQLALLITFMPMVATGRDAVLGAIAGMLIGALLVIIVQTPIVRYGLTLTVTARAAFGVRGAWLLSVLRVFLSAVFFAQACVLAMETLLWCILCAFPDAAAPFQRVPIVGSLSLVSVIGSVVLAGVAWFLARETSTLVRLLLLLPSLGLPIALFLLPGNLPPHAAWDVVDIVGRSQNTALTPVIVGAAFWSASIWLMSASDARRLPSQISQGAAAVAGVVPWLLATLAFALAVLSSGKGDTGLFDLPALACRRASNAGLIGLLGCAVIGFIWPLAHVAKRGVQIGAQELATQPRTRRLIEWTTLVIVLMFAIVSRAGFLNVMLDVQLLLAALYVVMAACAVVHYFAVERGRFVLDDLYSERGPYRGLFGIAPAGLLALVAAITFYYASALMLDSRALRAALVMPVALLAQIIFGNIQRLLVR